MNEDTQEALGRGWRKNNAARVQLKAEAGGDIYAQVEQFRAKELLTRMEEGKRWMEDMIDEKVFVEDDQSGADFLDQLRDGVALARLADAFYEGTNQSHRKKHVNAKKGSAMEIMTATDNMHYFF